MPTAIFVLLGILFIPALIGFLISVIISRRKNNKKTTETENRYFYFSKELLDSDIPYNGSDFIDRFKTDAWDLRN